jgi:hypothetical protein
MIVIDQPITSCRRGDRIALLFAALHESAFGTKRTYRDNRLFVRFRGKADMGRRTVPIVSAASDPKRT